MIAALLGRTRLVATVVTLLTLVGLTSWFTMPRQEDPSFAQRFATVLVPFPGASTLDIERLVLEPLEEELQEVVELRDVRATARPGIGLMTLRLRDSVAPEATDDAWDEVRRGLDRASGLLPPEAFAPTLDHGVGDPASAVYLITGSSDPLELRAAMIQLEHTLERVGGVKRVMRLGDPGQRIAVQLAPETGERIGIGPQDLANLLRSRNVTAPGGSILLDGRSVPLRHRGELEAIEQVRRTPVVLPSGASLPLDRIASVSLETAVPRGARILHNGLPAVGLAVVPVPAQDVVGLGVRLRAAVGPVQAELAPLQIQTFAFQPDLVQQRIGSLTRSLLLGVFIVGIVLVVAMGPRMGLLVASIVPLVALSSVAVYAMGGGVLHQISIAALVLALGLLVDNAIVVAEAVQQHIDAGHPDPGVQAVKELAIPLGTATGTTVAAFVPMLLAEGGTADFTRTIPLVVVLALVLSYGFALVVTPALAARLLRPRVAGTTRLEAVGQRLARLTVRRPGRVLLALGLAVIGAGLLTRWVPAEFFPMSDRAQLLVSIELPEGTHALHTETTVAQIGAKLHADPVVTDVTAFVGGGLPRFYYNLNDTPSSPHRAEIVVGATDAKALVPLMRRIRRQARAWPDATVVPKRLQQGPPVGAPVQIRLQGNDLVALQDAAHLLVAALRDVPGTRDVRHDLGTGLPTLEFRAADRWTTTYGLGRSALSTATLAQTHGLAAGAIRNGSDPIPLRVRAPAGEHTPPGRLATLPVRIQQGSVPLAQLSSVTPSWTPAAIKRRDGVREVTVAAELGDGATFASVLAALELPTLPNGVELSFGGAAEGSGQANSALLSTLPLGLGLLVFFLLLEFDSFRRLGIVLTTVPLAAVGVVPGLALTGQPFGFMSLLGVIALVGIVVNNAIVLLNVIERGRSEGAEIDEAIAEAVRVRLRPILLTTLTTVAGMIPLALSSSALWPPLAWAMISGLLASTALTLLAVPAAYKLLFDGMRPPRWLAGALLLLPGAASAQVWTLDEVIDAAERAPHVIMAEAEADAAARYATGRWLDAATPKIGAQADTRWRDAAVALDTPIGPFVQQPKQLTTYGARVVQPVFDPLGWSVARGASHRASAAASIGKRTRAEVAGTAIDLVFDLAVIEARIEAEGSRVEALSAAASTAADLTELGLGLPAEALRARVALDDARLELARAQSLHASVRDALAALLGRESVPEITLATTEWTVTSDRSDLDAARHQQRAARTDRVARATHILPKVTIDAGWQATNNESLVKPSWTDVGISASWTLGAGRIADIDAATASLRSAGARVRALEAQVRLDQANANRQLALATEEVEVRRQAVLHAEQAATVVNDLFEQQLSPLTDLLAVQAELAGQRVGLRAAEVGVMRARLAISLAG